MCLIVHREKGRIPWETLEYNRYKNPDGFGIAFRSGGNLVVEKFLKSEAAGFLERLREVNSKRVEAVYHFRLATHGDLSIANCHPFEYEDPQEGRVLVFHNGIIDIKTSGGESDTAAFVRLVLARLPSRWWADNALRFLVEGSIGWSRMLVMTESETVRFPTKQWESEGAQHYSIYPHPPKAWTKPSSIPQSIVPYGGGFVRNKNGEIFTFKSETNIRYHFGHRVRLEGIAPFGEDGSGDECAEAFCETCVGSGEWFKIKGSTYFVMDHFTPDGVMYVQSGATGKE